MKNKKESIIINILQVIYIKNLMNFYLKLKIMKLILILLLIVELL